MVQLVQTSKRSLGLDLLRILMAAMVVALHTHWLSRTSLLWDQLTVNGLFRMAVPVFFLINGYYAFDAIEHGRIKPWLKRILQIYCFWMVLYLPAYVPHGGGNGLGLRSLLVTLVFGYWHLWYMAALVLAGLLLWLLRARSSSQLICLALGLYAMALALEAARLGGVDQIPVKLYRSFVFDALPFLLIGYVMRRDEFTPARSTTWLCAIVGLAGLLLESLAAWRFAAPFTDADLYVSLLLFCPAVFLLVRDLPVMTASDLWAKASSAIYFSHVGFLLFAERLGIASGLPLFGFVLTLSVLATWPLSMLSRRFRFVL